MLADVHAWPCLMLNLACHLNPCAEGLAGQVVLKTLATGSSLTVFAVQWYQAVQQSAGVPGDVKGS